MRRNVEIQNLAQGSSASEIFRKEYCARIHRAQDFIEENLGQPLLLEAIAQAAHFSPYHFHRLYRAITGETLYQFIQRIRLERAASRLRSELDASVTVIALESGFSSSATFARAFKGYFGISASAYRKGGESKDCKTLGKDGKVSEQRVGYSAVVDFDTFKFKWSGDMQNVQAKSIEVRDLPAKTLAYVRHVGPYAGNSGLFERLFGAVMSWAGPRGLFQPPQTEMISVYHDNPEITDQEKLRISVGITVPADTRSSGEIGVMEIPAGKYVCALFEIAGTEYAEAWNSVCAEWLPQSGWQPAEGPCYESYLNDHTKHPEGKHVVEIRINVKPL